MSGHHEHFRGGSPAVRDRLNRMADAIRGVTNFNLRGSEFISVNKIGGGHVLSLNLDAVRRRLGRTEAIADETDALPVRLERKAGTFLVCRACRCTVKKKAAVRSAECCKGLWPEQISGENAGNTGKP